MIIIKSDELSEKQLAEIAIAIQNRWDVPTFVKMHEVVVSDDEEFYDEESRMITQPLDAETFTRGFSVIMENLEMVGAFDLIQSGKAKYKLRLVDKTRVPRWMSEIDGRRPTPEGILECPHCGKWFNTDIELSLHTKLHYII